MCGQSPLYIPTTVNAQIRNIDAVDVEATNISCVNLTVQGNPISNVFQNVTATSGNTAFTGGVTADSLTATDVIANTLSVSGDVDTGALSTTSITSTGSITGTSLNGTIGTAAQPNITSVGILTGVSTSGTITQTGGSATLKSTTVDSLTTAGNITQTGGSATLKSTTVDSLTTAGNITQTGAAATASLKAVTASSINCTGTFTSGTFTPSSISVGGNITQTSGTTSLLGTTIKGTLSAVSADILSGSITTGAATFTTPTAFTAGYGSYTIRYLNLGCSGNFTPYIQFVKTSTAYTTGYRVTTDMLGYTGSTSTSTNRVTLQSNATGLANAEQISGKIVITKINSTQWFVEGWSQSNSTSTCTIWGTFTESGQSGIDKILFGVTGGTLNSATATYTIEPNPHK